MVCDSTMKTWYENKTDMSADWDIVELVKYLRDNWPQDRNGSARSTPIMLVCHNPHKVFLKLHKIFQNDPEWNTRFSVNTGEKFYVKDGASKEPKVRTTQDIRISFFGFRDSNRKTKYLHPISPHDFMENFKEYGDDSWPEYIRLYHWGGHVRKWMQKHKLRFATTRGGLAAQLLRDERFYPKSRRKIPKHTNEKARVALPGNFYAMQDRYIDTMFPSVYVIDQENAHHYAAEQIDLPNANTLFARGRFATLSDEPFVREKSIGFQNLISEHGLFRCRVWVPKPTVNLVMPWTEQHGLTDIFLFSNELDLAKELGIEIRHISYAWTSRELDTGLSKYAQWAQRETLENPDHRPWLKPTLLSAYGILGVRPRKMEMAYFRSAKGKPYRYLLGPTPVMMQRMITDKDIQAPIANLIHRGMIEAETRKLSIQLAMKMEAEKHTVIAIHSDSVLIKDEGQQLPLLPPPWRVKDRLSRFRALDQVSFRSDQVTILPGRKRHAKG